MNALLFRRLISLATVATNTALVSAASHEWTFNRGDLSSDFGNGVMSYRDSATALVTTFGATDGSGVPHIDNQPAQYLHFPALQPAEGYALSLPDTAPNGGGTFINYYSLVLDLYSPDAAGWQAIFNTDALNGNDADFYIAPDGSLGIGALGYSAPGLIAQDTWHRIAFTADLAAGNVTYYVNGAAVHSRTGSSLRDGRFSLNPGSLSPNLLLFTEGDPTGTYSHEMYVNSIYFTDQTLSPAEVFALGGPNAAGIVVVPEPAVLTVLALGLWALLAARRERS